MTSSPEPLGVEHVVRARYAAAAEAREAALCCPVDYEPALLDALAEVGFHGIALDRWSDELLTVTAHKGERGPCFETNQAVIYRGPWKRVEDDDGHVLHRGQRTAVCARTYERLSSPPYRGDVIAIAPRVAIPEAERELFDCSRTALRDPRETKGRDYRESRAPEVDDCVAQGCC
jgi:hypothetical protein